MILKGTSRSFFNVISFSLICNEKKENVSELIHSIKKYENKKKYDLEIDLLEEKKKKNLFNIDYEEVKNLSYLSEYDKKIFITFNKIKMHEEEDLKYLKNLLLKDEKNQKNNDSSIIGEDSNESDETDDEDF